MNEKKFLSYLEQYHQWLKDHQRKAKDELAEREAYAKEMQKYDKKRLLCMTAEDVYILLFISQNRQVKNNYYYDKRYN